MLMCFFSMNLFRTVNICGFLLLAAILPVGPVGCHKNSNQNTVSSLKITVMSYNIRNANSGHNRKNWNRRKEQLINEVLFYNPDFMGIQEALYVQMKYLDSLLTGRKYIGVGRKDGKEGGEYNAIFYNANHFELVPGTDSTMWLSSTPGKPSVGWDAALPRIVTWGEFRSKAT